MNKKTIAIITARGGSKRIPKKNIKEFAYMYVQLNNFDTQKKLTL